MTVHTKKVLRRLQKKLQHMESIQLVAFLVIIFLISLNTFLRDIKRRITPIMKATLLK